jgi:hypothetical protein
VDEQLIEVEQVSRFVDVDDLDFESPELDFDPRPDSDFLEGLPSPKSWLIEGVVPKGLTILWGAPSSGKSFVAIDWGQSIATGTSWLNRYSVEQGDVLYISAEADPEYRIRAWWQEHSVPENLRGAFHVIDMPVNFIDSAHVASLNHWLNERKIRPAVFIIDTLAASMGMGGHDENGSDMSSFIARFNAFRSAYGADGIIVHHGGHEAKHPRGHSSLIAAANAVLHLKQLGKVVTSSKEVELVLETTKAPRDGRPTESINLIRSEVELVNGMSQQVLDRDNEHRVSVGLSPRTIAPDITSCVIRFGKVEVVTESSEGRRQTGHKKGADAKDQQALEALASFGAAGARSGEWQRKSGLKGGSFTRVAQRLQETGQVKKDGPRFLVVIPFAVAA